MSQPVNLNKVRKARTRAAKKAQADANAVRFGTSKADRDAAKQETARQVRKLDGKLLDLRKDGDT